MENRKHVIQGQDKQSNKYAKGTETGTDTCRENPAFSLRVTENLLERWRRDTNVYKFSP